MVGVVFVYIDTVYGFLWVFFLCLVGCFSMIIWTPTVLSVIYACVLYFCICTCSAQLSMFHMEKRSRNTLIIIIIIISFMSHCLDLLNVAGWYGPSPVNLLWQSCVRRT